MQEGVRNRSKTVFAQVEVPPDTGRRNSAALNCVPNYSPGALRLNPATQKRINSRRNALAAFRETHENHQTQTTLYPSIIGDDREHTKRMEEH